MGAPGLDFQTWESNEPHAAKLFHVEQFRERAI